MIRPVGRCKIYVTFYSADNVRGVTLLMKERLVAYQ
jgi:hypothetical protein